MGVWFGEEGIKIIFADAYLIPWLAVYAILSYPINFFLLRITFPLLKKDEINDDDRFIFGITTLFSPITLFLHFLVYVAIPLSFMTHYIGSIGLHKRDE